MLNILEYTKELINRYVNSDDFVIDATMGNGNDTLYLAKRAKHVYAFDVQNQALVNTKKLLDQNKISNYQLICDGHQNIKNYVTDEISLAIFNLGYLPKGDKTITTTYDTTIEAIDSVLDLLKVGGICILVIYTGHENGKIESEKINDYTCNLNRFSYNVLKYDFINKKNPPYIVCIEKRQKK